MIRGIQTLRFSISCSFEIKRESLKEKHSDSKTLKGPFKKLQYMVRDHKEEPMTAIKDIKRYEAREQLSNFQD